MKALLIRLVVVVGIAGVLPGTLAGQRNGDPKSSESLLIHQPATFHPAATPDFAPNGLPPGATILLRREKLNQPTLPVQRMRPGWLFPAIGAGVGVLGMGWLIYESCRDTPCIFNPLAPVAVGIVVGGAAGGIVELITRMIEDASVSDRLRAKDR